MINPYKIGWSGYTNIDFDTRTCLSFDSDSGALISYLGREAVLSESHNGSRKIPHAYKWNEVLSPAITFIKEDFSDFTSEDTRKLLKWITGNPGTGVLSIYSDDSEAPEYEMIGNFINVEQYKLGNGRCVGFIAYFESIQPFALSPVRKITKVIDTPIPFTINVDTDEPQSVIYPKVTIKEGNSFVVKADAELIGSFELNKTPPAEYVPGTVYEYNGNYYYAESGVMVSSSSKPTKWDYTSAVIKNITTGTETRTSHNIIGEEITLDGANRIVSSDRSTGRIFGNDFNFQWLPLVEGENEIKVIGNCTVIIEYREIIKVGDLV